MENLIYYYLAKRRRQANKKRQPVSPFIESRLLCGEFVVKFNKLRENENSFYKYFKVSIQTYDELFSILEPYLKINNLRVKSVSVISPMERLAITLRLLDKELKQWRQKVLDMFTSELTSTPVISGPECEERPPSPEQADYPLLSPASPAQPADPDKSIIDQLMRCAEISKQIEDGDVNGSFSRALSAADLSLVMAACRAAGPARVFAPCRLQQPVLLALLQQLATDMLHETHLKCRYLEEALISLNTSNPATRAHLPTVVGEVRRHLMKFLVSYPKHVARRRVTLIIMAADNLLNYCT